MLISRLRGLPAAAMSLILVALLAACGGGGGGGGSDDGSSGSTGQPSANSDITASNAESFATPMARAVATANASSAMAGSSISASSGQALALQRAGLSMRSTVRSFALREQALDTETKAKACNVAGSLTVTATDDDDDNKLSEGDSIEFSYDDCQQVADGEVLDGSFTLTLQDLDFDNDGDVTGFTVSGTFDQFSTDTGTLDGAFTLSLNESDGDVELRFAYSAVAITSDSQTVVYSFSLSATESNDGTTSFSLAGSLVVDGETYSLTQTTAFESDADGTIIAGELVLEDADGDQLRLTAQSDGTVDFAFYPDGSSTPTFTLADQAWADHTGTD